METKVNILMVDDEPTNLLALEATLEGLNQNLVRATSGKEALRQVLDKDFAVILLDVQMAEMNGIEAASAIRERERSRHIPIIFLTGMGHTEEMVFKGYSAGAVDYLIKPIVPDVLRAKVEIFVELALIRHRLQEEIAERTRSAAEISKLNAALGEKNAELEKQTLSLQETNSELEGYSYSISHDMRAPLRAMTGYSEILIEECAGQLSEEHRGFLNKIHSGARRLDHLIEDVLSYSRISRSRQVLEKIDADKLTRDIIEQYPEMAAAEADVQVEGTLPPVWGNEAMLTQCFSNLLGNAIKFMAPGVKPRVRVRAENEGEDVVLWFEDNGIGIAPADMARIFDIFVKVHSGDVYMGTGIGLSIVRKAVEKMGGKVGVESKMGKGSRFWLRLKRVEGAD